MAWINKIPPHGGKSATASLLAFTSINDLVVAIGLFGKIPLEPAEIPSLLTCSNNGRFSKSNFSQHKLFNSKTKKVLNWNDFLAIVDAWPSASIDTLKTGRYFRRSSKAYINTICEDIELGFGEDLKEVEISESISVLCRVRYTKNPEPILFIEDVYCPYSIFDLGYKWEGCANIAIEGLVPFPTHFVNPILIDSADVLSAEARVSRSIMSSQLDLALAVVRFLTPEANDIKAALPYADYGNPINFLEAYRDEIDELTSAVPELANSSIWKKLWIKYKKESRLARDYGLTPSSLLSTSLQSVKQSGSLALFTQKDGGMGTKLVNIPAFLFSMSGLYFIDSLTSILYSGDEFTKGSGAGARGLNTSLLLALASSTYSHCVLLYAPSGHNDPLEDYDLAGSLNGDLECRSTAWESQVTNRYVNLPILLTVTSRFTNRDTDLKISLRDEDDIIVTTKIDGGPYDGKHIARINLTTNTLLEVD